MDAQRGRRQKEISLRQEEKIASDIGGRTVAGSGAARSSGGSDVRKKGEYRVEAKYTEAQFYSIKLSELEKLRVEAAKGGAEQPVFQIGFKRPATRHLLCFAVLPWHDVLLLDYPGFSWIRWYADKKSIRFYYSDARYCGENEGIILRFSSGERFYIISWSRFLEETQ